MVRIVKTIAAAQSIYFTPKGLEEAKEELAFLTTTKRFQITERISQAMDFGSVSENAEYDAALEEQTLVENRIAYLENVLKHAKVISESSGGNLVVIGSKVAVEMDGEIDEFKIVGKVEANPAQKMISNESPLGAALLGAKIGETVEVATPIVCYRCKVLKIK